MSRYNKLAPENLSQKDQFKFNELNEFLKAVPYLRQPVGEKAIHILASKFFVSPVMMCFLLNPEKGGILWN